MDWKRALRDCHETFSLEISERKNFKKFLSNLTPISTVIDKNAKNEIATSFLQKKRKKEEETLKEETC